MEINPWTAIALNALYAVLMGLTVPVVDALGFTGHDAQIVAWAGVAAVPINLILHAFSAPVAGPAAPPPPPVVKAANALAALPPDAGRGQVELAKTRLKAAVEDHQP